MTNIGVGKKIIITLLSIMVSLLVVFSALTIIEKVINKPEPQAAGEYTIGDDINAYTELALNYEKYDTFLISSPGALKLFSAFVTAGISFANKTVKLTKDIECTDFVPIGCEVDTPYFYTGVNGFYGNFDGCGHKLKLRLSLNNLYLNPDGKTVYLGMFCRTYGSTIKNLSTKYLVLFYFQNQT